MIKDIYPGNYKSSWPSYLTVTDPGMDDTHTAMIDWGDGNSSTGKIIELEGVNPGRVSSVHTYATDGIYTVRVTVSDDDGASHFDTFLVTLADSTAPSNPVPTVSPSTRTGSAIHGLKFPCQAMAEPSHRTSLSTSVMCSEMSTETNPSHRTTSTKS